MATPREVYEHGLAKAQMIAVLTAGHQAASNQHGNAELYMAWADKNASKIMEVNGVGEPFPGDPTVFGVDVSNGPDWTVVHTIQRPSAPWNTTDEALPGTGALVEFEVRGTNAGIHFGQYYNCNRLPWVDNKKQQLFADSQIVRWRMADGAEWSEYNTGGGRQSLQQSVSAQADARARLLLRECLLRMQGDLSLASLEGEVKDFLRQTTDAPVAVTPESSSIVAHSLMRCAEWFAKRAQDGDTSTSLQLKRLAEKARVVADAPVAKEEKAQASVAAAIGNLTMTLAGGDWRVAAPGTERAYSPQWKEALRQARNEGGRLGHNCVASLHLLLGIIKTGYQFPGVNVIAMRAAAELASEPNIGPTVGIFPHTPETKSIIRSAQVLAAADGSPQFEVNHLVRALRCVESDAKKIMEKYHA